jgi:hypothetical protein
VTENQANQYRAGSETAKSDARRGVVREPHARDAKFWAAGYRDTCDDLARTFGPNWKEKMKETAA